MFENLGGEGGHTPLPPAADAYGPTNCSKIFDWEETKMEKFCNVILMTFFR